MTRENKIATTIAIIAFVIITTSLIIINRKQLGQKLQASIGVNPFLDYNVMTSEIKNNNPLNIRHSSANQWQGEILPRKEGEFAVFDTLEHGIRAAIIILHSYIVKYNPDTIRSIIARWAPPSDNNDDVAYEKVVMEQLNKIYSSLTSTTALTFDYKMLTDIAWAMSAMEQGYKHQPSRQTFIDVQQKYFK